MKTLHQFSCRKRCLNNTRGHLCRLSPSSTSLSYYLLILGTVIYFTCYALPVVSSQVINEELDESSLDDIPDFSTIENDFLASQNADSIEDLKDNVIIEPVLGVNTKKNNFTLKKTTPKTSIVPGGGSINLLNLTDPNQLLSQTPKPVIIPTKLRITPNIFTTVVPGFDSQNSIFGKTADGDDDDGSITAQNGTKQPKHQHWNTKFQTHEGVLSGKIIDVPGGKPIAIYFGVPYAAPPVGPNRFKPPQPLEPWEGERKAVELPPICAQYDPISKNISGIEDCLYLNIFAPKPTGLQKHSVMVFIHGGFFLSGSGNYYPAYQLASRYNVIVVTLNYRLGIFGFLRLKGAVGNSCGNCGIQDQLTALTWIRDNIPNIGGNPDRVTVFGQGSGGTCVKLLLTIPRARGLFDAAIAQGGSLATLEEAREPKLIDAVQFVAREAQCPNIKTNDEIMECLRDLPAQNLLTVASRFCSTDDQSFLNHPFQPYIEEITGQKAEGKSFEEIMDKIPFNSDTVLISGINSAEGVIPYYPPLLPDGAFNLSDGKIVVSPEAYDNKIVPHILHSNNYPMDEPAMRKAAAFAYLPWSNPKDPEKLADSSFQITGDQLFTIPYLKDLKYFAKTHKKLYAYLFNYISNSPNAPEYAKVPWFRNGTARGSELVYLFGYPTTKKSFLETTPHSEVMSHIPGFDKNYQYSLTDIGMSEFMMETWANIAKRRKPSLRKGRWPRVKPNDINHLVIAGMGRSGPLLYTKKDYKSMQSYFWDSFYPDLEKQITLDEKKVLESAKVESKQCTRYRRATWGIVTTLLLLGLLYTLLRVLRHSARKRRKKFSSTPTNPNLVYK